MGIEATNTVSTQIEMKVGLTRKEVEHTNNSEAIKLFDLLDDGDGVLSQKEVDRYNNPTYTENGIDYTVGSTAESYSGFSQTRTFKMLNKDYNTSELSLEDFILSRDDIEKQYQLQIDNTGWRERGWKKDSAFAEQELKKFSIGKAVGLGALFGLICRVVERGQTGFAYRGLGKSLLKSTVLGALLGLAVRAYFRQDSKKEIARFTEQANYYESRRLKAEKERDIFRLAMDRAVAANPDALEKAAETKEFAVDFSVDDAI